MVTNIPAGRGVVLGVLETCSVVGGGGGVVVVVVVGSGVVVDPRPSLADLQVSGLPLLLNTHKIITFTLPVEPRYLSCSINLLNLLQKRDDMLSKASHFISFPPILLTNSIIHEHSYKILYLSN